MKNVNHQQQRAKNLEQLIESIFTGLGFCLMTMRLAVMRILTVLFIKFCLSLFDIFTDLNAGIRYLNRTFGLYLYYLAYPGDTDVSLYGQDIYWGLLTIMIIWVPGTVQIGLRAASREWDKMKISDILKSLSQYMVLWLLWPFFSVLL